MTFPYLYRWDKCGRKGQPCKVTARAKRWKASKTQTNSVRVEFQDGFKMVTSGNALKKRKA